MSADSAFVVMLLTLGCVLVARLIYSFLCGFSERMPNDVYPFLLSLDMEALNGTFHPEAEEHFRNRLSEEEFRKVQFKRIHLALHYCNQVAHNARVFMSWMKYERSQNWGLLDPEVRELALCLRDACAQCGLSSLVIRLRLRWWLVRMQLLPFLPPPAFKTLLRVGSADMISFYETVLTLAENFSQIYGEDYHEKLVQAL